MTDDTLATPRLPLGDPASLQRLKMTIAYRGTNYHGWQFQLPSNTYKGPPLPVEQGLPTIQEIVTRTLRGVVGHPVKLSGSSRTDARVHAKRQVAHFTTNKPQIPLVGLRRAINARLPDDILIRDIERVPIDFDAATWTRSKRYQYLIWNEEDRPVMTPDLAWHRWQPLDIDAMTRAATYLVGTHDFETFARPGHGRIDTVRKVLACDVSYRKPRLVIGVEGTGFLWNMVRIIVGTLVEVGLGKRKAEDIPAMLAAKDRRASGGTAPPHGLYLQWIKYGDSPHDRYGGDRFE